MKFQVTDKDGASRSAIVAVTVRVLTFAELEAKVREFCGNAGVANGLIAKLDSAAAAPNATRGNTLDAFVNQVRAQTGKALTSEQAAILIELAGFLR